MTATAKIIRIDHRRRQRSQTIRLDDTEAVLALLQAELFGFTYFSDIAAKAGVAPTTVANLAYGQTQSPRANTVIRILTALGWKVWASK